MILLGRVDEADEYLRVAHSQIVRTGRELWLGRYYHASGLLELAKGDTSTALSTLEQAFEIFEKINHVMLQNWSLLALARAEVVDDCSRPSDWSGMPGRWLSRLETHAETRCLHGIAMQAALIRSDLYENQGRVRDARETLQHALGITDSLGVRPIRKIITDRITELDRLIQEA